MWKESLVEFCPNHVHQIFSGLLSSIVFGLDKLVYEMLLALSLYRMIGPYDNAGHQGVEIVILSFQSGMFGLVIRIYSGTQFVKAIFMLYHILIWNF